ncbi:MAG TPA: GtrA family protein [Nitrolancea sp.]|nr:GtrA family protein [Nitrolancea sp.]
MKRPSSGARPNSSQAERDAAASRPRGGHLVRQCFHLFFGDPARLVRFCLTGGVAALVQLAVLRLLTADHWEALLSNGIGMALAAQVNFTLSSAFTWRDRWVRAGLHRRWSMYQLTILVSALVNMLVFIVARLFVEQMIAALLGIAVAAALNFAAGDRIIFRLKQAVAALEHEHDGATEVVVPVYADKRRGDRHHPSD